MFFLTQDELVEQQLQLGNYDTAYRLAVSNEVGNSKQLMELVTEREAEFNVNYNRILKTDTDYQSKYCELGHLYYKDNCIDLANRSLKIAESLGATGPKYERLLESISNYGSNKRTDLSNIIGSQLYSASLEQEQVLFLLSQISRCNSGFCVDIGAGDGLHWSNSRKLIEMGFNAILIEGSEKLFDALKTTCQPFSKSIALVNEFVAPHTILEILASNKCPQEFDYLSIDIDSFDCYICEKILSVYTPSVIVIELNERVPPPFEYIIEKSLTTVKADMSMISSASISYYARNLESFGYKLVMLEYNNLIAIKYSKFSESVHRLVRSAETLYSVGYRLRNDRDTLFPHNRQMSSKFGVSNNLVVSDYSFSLDGLRLYSEYLKSKDIPFHIKLPL
jgi:hypothetical protein